MNSIKIMVVAAVGLFTLAASARTVDITSYAARNFVQAALGNGYPMMIVDADSRRVTVTGPALCHFETQGLPDGLIATADCYEGFPGMRYPRPSNAVGLAVQLQKYGKYVLDIGFPSYAIQSADCTMGLKPPRYHCLISVED